MKPARNIMRSGEVSPGRFTLTGSISHRRHRDSGLPSRYLWSRFVESKPGASAERRQRRTQYVDLAGMRRARVALVIVAAMAGLLFPQAALAGAPRELATQMPGVSGPSGIAINATDDVWVGEPSKGIVSEYAPYPSTEKLAEVGNGSLAVEAVAVNDATGRLYVVAGGTVDVFEPAAANHSEPIEKWETVQGQDIAIDNSGGPTAGTVYVLNCNSGYPCGGTLTAYHANGSPAEFEVSETASISTGNDYEVAVDNHGNIYLADAAGGAVEEVNPAGEHTENFTRPPGDAEYYPADVAVDPTSGNVLALNGSYGGSYPIDDIDEFLSTGEFVDRITPTPTAPLSAFNRERMAISSKGYLYVAEPGGRLDIFDPNVAVPSITYHAPENPTPTSATLSATVDPRAGEGGTPVTKCAFEYGPRQGEYNLGSVPCLDPSGEQIGTPTKPIESTLEVHFVPEGLTPESGYHYRLVLVNGSQPANVEYGADQIYTPHYVTELETGTPSEVEGTSATLTGTFTGNGEDTHYYFEWGTNRKYGTNTAQPPGPGTSTGSGSHESVSFRVAGKLEPVTRYHYRVVAEDGKGISYGRDRSFITTPSPPLISESVIEVHADRATLTARINPGGADTRYHFEWGTEGCSAEPNPCTSVPSQDVDIGAAKGFQNVSTQLSGLLPGTTYYYRVVATNEESPSGGTISSEDRFTTFPFLLFKDECPNAHVRQQTGAASLLDCRGYELVSASNSGGYDVESNLVQGESPLPGYPGAAGVSGISRVAYGVHDGGIPETGNPTDDGVDSYVATRSSGGWTTQYVGIPANDPYAKEPFASPLLEGDASLDTLAFGGEDICQPCFADGSSGEPLRLPSGELVQGMVGSIPQADARPAGYVAARFSADGSGFVFGSTSRFTPEAEEGQLSIYERNLRTDETHVVSRTDAGGDITCLINCSSDGVGELGISKDGSHVLVGQLVSQEGNAKYWHLYMDVNNAQKSIAITPSGGEGVLFDGMTEDGSKIFFSSEEHLTGEDEEHSGPSIFMWEEGHPLALMSKGDNAGNPGEAGNTATCEPSGNSKHEHWNTAGTQANCGVVGIGGGRGVASQSGTVYFLSPEQLDGSADGVNGSPNLYVAQPGQPPKFVTTLESSSNAPLPEARRPFLRSFGPFTKPTGVAIGPEGNAYVLDLTGAEIGGLVEKVSPSGYLVTSFGENGKINGSETPAKSFSEYGPSNIATELAVDRDPTSSSFGDLYVPDVLNGVVDKFSPTGKYLSQIAVAYPTGVAVDPTTGNLYVAQGLGGEFVVRVFDSSGNPMTSFETLPFPTGLAVNSNGTVYVVTGGGILGEAGTTESYEPSKTSPLEYKSSEGRQFDVHPSFGVAVDAADNRVYIDEGTQINEFSQAGSQIGVPFGSAFLLRINWTCRQ